MNSEKRILNECIASVNAEQEMIGECLPMVKLKQTVAKMAPTDAPVLISGETGTGKELVARLLHGLSPRADGPFVAVNCPALPVDLFQAEVFGHEKGAFTSADHARPGRIEAARGGTLFLDEIGDLPMEIQAVLLRFLQEGTYERIGSVRPLRADVRILAATHTDLKKAVDQFRFRDDLFYRLNALHLHCPPLRDRGEDKLLLAAHFVDECTRQLGLRPHTLGKDAQRCILAYDWPGNVRELRNRILQALVLCEQNELTADDLDLADTPANERSGQDADTATLQECRMTAERAAICRALEACKGNVETAATSLKISRAQLYRLIRLHDIRTG